MAVEHFVAALDEAGKALADPGTPLDGSGAAMDDPGMPLEPSGMATDDPGMALDRSGMTMEDFVEALDDLVVTLAGPGMPLEWQNPLPKAKNTQKKRQKSDFTPPQPLPADKKRQLLNFPG
jgi:hypothetical protein